MVEFGDELIIESYKIPWLIWIQLLVMILLVILLFFGFTVFYSDPSNPSPAAAVAATAASSSADRAAASPTHPRNPTSTNMITKVERQRARSDAGTSAAALIREEDRSEESPMKDSIFQHPNHPCNYFGLAKRALFKCFGLDSSSESPSSHRRDKQD